jgi:adenylate kinase
MLIVITGTPGTGKSVISELLSRKIGIELIKISDFVNRNKLYERFGREKLVDTKELFRALKSTLANKKDAIIEGHLACEMPLNADFVFVLRTHPDVLRERLKARGYDRAKIEQNVMAEMLDYCTQRARKNYKVEVIEIDTSKKKPNQCVTHILRVMKKKIKKTEDIDYTQELMKYLGLKE